MTTPLAGSIEGRIAEELGVRERQVRAAVELLDGGSTVPFIARYRKEATEMLDDAQLRTLEERLRYLRELEERRTAILASLVEQQKLTPELDAFHELCRPYGVVDLVRTGRVGVPRASARRKAPRRLAAIN